MKGARGQFKPGEGLPDAFASIGATFVALTEVGGAEAERRRYDSENTLEKTVEEATALGLALELSLDEVLFESVRLAHV